MDLVDGVCGGPPVPGASGAAAAVSAVPAVAVAPGAGRLRSLASVVRATAVSAGRHGVPGLAAEGAFFLALALFPTVLTLVGLLRALRPALGGDAAALVTQALTRLLRVVLTARGSAAADAADQLLTAPSRGLLGLGTLVSLLVFARALRSLLRGLWLVAGMPPRRSAREWRTALLLAAVLLVATTLTLGGLTLGPLLGHRGDFGAPDGLSTGLGEVWLRARWPVGVLAVVVGAVTLLLPAYVSAVAAVSPTLGSLGGGLIVLGVGLPDVDERLHRRRAQRHAVRARPPPPPTCASRSGLSPGHEVGRRPSRSSSTRRPAS